MSVDRSPEASIDYILAQAKRFAGAKAQRAYLEEFRKSKKALLMAESDEKTAVAREQYAYSHPEYIALHVGLKAAIEAEETLKWKLIAAQLTIEIWRSREASNRSQDRALR